MSGWAIAGIVVGSALLWVLMAKIQWEVWRKRCRDVGGFWYGDSPHILGAGFGVPFWPVIFPILLVVMGVDAFVDWRSQPRQKRAAKREQKLADKRAAEQKALEDNLALVAKQQELVKRQLELAEAQRQLKVYQQPPVNGDTLR